MLFLSYPDEDPINCGYRKPMNASKSNVEFFQKEAKSVNIYKTAYGLISLAVSSCISTNDADPFGFKGRHLRLTPSSYAGTNSADPAEFNDRYPRPAPSNAGTNRAGPAGFNDRYLRPAP